MSSKERKPDEPTAGTVAKLDSLPTIAGLESLRDRLPNGSLIAGRYEIRDLLGIGGMGAVYRAHDRLLDLEVALKVLRGEVAADSSFSQRFRQELLVARSVTHRHVVRIHDLGEHDGMPFMTMDLIAGRSLRDLLAEQGCLPVPHALRIVREVAEALGEAHRQGVVHRDLKPSNILIDPQGQSFVTDFGVARSLHAPGLTRTGEVLGTPDYLAPEQARGEKVDGRCDLYALGLICFEMVSGERPYAGGSLLEVLAQHMSGRARTLRDVGASVPAPVDAIIRRCLAPATADRYPDAAALLADLDDLRRPARRRWLRRLEWVAAALLLVTAAVVLWRQVSHLLADRAPPAAAATASAGAPRPAGHSVAILPFTIEGSSAADLGWSETGLPELLAGSLRENETIRVVDSARVAQTLRDIGFDAATLDERALARVADLLGVDRVVTGRVAHAGQKVKLMVGLGEVAGGEMMMRAMSSQSGGVGELFALTERAGEELRRHLEPSDQDPPRRALTASQGALRAYSEGTALLAASETLKAAPLLERAVAADPSFTAAWVELSRAYQRLGRAEEAEQAARRAVETAGPDSGRAGFEARAQEALVRDQPEEAQLALAALVERYPNDLPARVALAEAYGGQGKFAEAMDSLRAVVARDAKDPRAWYLLGRFAIQAGELQLAADEYLPQAMLLHNRHGNRQGQAEVYNALGVAFERLGKVDEAVRQYRQAAALREELGDRSGVAVTQLNLGSLLMNQGDFAGAGGAFASALAIHRSLDNRAGVAKVENAFGALEEERGNHTAALEHYRQALKLRTSLGDEAALAQSYNNVGFAYYLLAEYDNARLHLDRSLELCEKHGNDEGAILAMQSRGACELAQGDWGAALKTLHDSLQRASAQERQHAIAVAQASLARLSFLEGRPGAALSSYREAAKIVDQLRFVRGQAEVTLGLAETLLEVGAVDEAAGHLDVVEGWREEGLGAEHRAQLALLRARLLVARGDGEGARRLFAAAEQAASRSQTPALLLEARLRAAAGAPAGRQTLRRVLDEARRIGNAALELEAAEALGRAELLAGDEAAAAEVLQAGAQRLRGVGSWRRAWALHDLLARTHQARGDAARAAEQRALARRELERVERATPAELRPGFETLPEVRRAIAASG